MPSDIRTSSSRRDFLKAASVMGLVGTPLLAGGGRPSRRKPLTSRIRIGQIKVYPVKGDLKANHATLMETLAGMARQHELDVVITPEGFLDGYVSTQDDVRKEDMPAYAVAPQTCSYVEAARDWAKRNKTWLIYGCTRTAADGIFNTALIINRDGRLIGAYDKLHLQTHDHKYTPGKHLNVYDSDFGTFGVMICADRRWPETVRTLALGGARIIMNPTYGMHGEMNLCMMRTRAYENGIYIAFTHPGQSLITGPKGNIVCNNKAKDRTFTVTEVDLSDSLLDKSGHLRDRRTDVYRL